MAIVYDEFEPFCKWERNEDQDVLEIHLREFKKEELKVQISNHGVLKISGERKLDESKGTKFYKEVPAPLNKYDTNAIHAKFVNSKLIITLPKLKTPVPQTEGHVSSSEADQAPKPGPTAAKLENGGGGGSGGGGSGGAEKVAPSAPGGGIVSTEWRFQVWKRKMMGLKMAKVAASLAATSAAVAVLVAAYAVYMYKSSVQEIDE